LIIQDQYIVTQCLEVETIINDSKLWANSDPKLGAHLATYINVMILGKLEDCIEYLVKRRAKKPGDVELENYISNDIEKRFRNPTYSNICDLLGRFSNRYREEFEKKFNKNCLEVDALNSILENKTNVAHYGLANLKISVNDVESYYKGVVNVLGKLEDLLVINP